MTEYSPENEPTWSDVVREERDRLALSELPLRDIKEKLVRNAEGGNTYEAALKIEAADRIERFDRLTRLLGLLAPGGTAPRTALEQIYIQSADNSDESPIVLELREILETHWGEWTPAIREAEGLPPIEPEPST